jgi:protein-disulfide isomerase
LLSLGLVLVAATPIHAQSLTKEQGDAILEELRQIRRLLEESRPERGGSPPARRGASAQTGKVVSVSVPDTFSLGRDDARVALVEFVDYECPFCRRFHLETFPHLRAKYVDSGKVRFIVKDLPLPFHKNARRAAEAARCAAGVGAGFWRMYEALLINGQNLGGDAIRTLSGDVGLTSEALDQCLSARFTETASRGR